MKYQSRLDIQTCWMIILHSRCITGRTYILHVDGHANEGHICSFIQTVQLEKQAWLKYVPAPWGSGLLRGSRPLNILPTSTSGAAVEPRPSVAHVPLRRSISVWILIENRRGVVQTAWARGMWLFCMHKRAFKIKVRTSWHLNADRKEEMECWWSLPNAICIRDCCTVDR